MEAVVMFVVSGEVGNGGEDWVLGRDADVIALADDVFALFAAAGGAEKIELAFDVFGVFGADAPMQGDDVAAATRETFDGGEAVGVGLHPARALRDEHDEAVGLIEKFGA